MNPTHHVFIAGGGGIGRALALMLLDEPSFSCRVTIGDASVTTAGEAAEFAGVAGPVESIVMPIDGTSPELAACLDGADAVLDCLPGSQAPRIAQMAREADAHYLNLTEYVAETDQVLEIARGASTAFALQCGLAPGTINVLGHHLFIEACSAWGCETVEAMRLRVGALPRHVRSPHFYGWTWSPVGVATEYVKPAVAVRNNRTVELPSLSERATLIVDGVTYEEDLTSGGAADLPGALGEKVRNLDYKTLRFPGHYSWVDGLLMEIPDDSARPGALQEAMEAAVPACQDDQVVIYADVEGRDHAGNLRVMKSARVIPGITVAGRPLRAIQSTTAAGIAEALRIVLEEKRTGPFLQSQIPTGRYLTGPFIRRAYGPLV